MQIVSFINQFVGFVVGTDVIIKWPYISQSGGSGQGSIFSGHCDAAVDPDIDVYVYLFSL
jgi:hypothetical protein